MKKEARICLLLLICVVSISAKKINRRSVLIDAHQNDKWVTIKASRNEIETAPGELVEIECEAAGTPQPRIQFLSKSSNLELSSYFVRQHSATALVKTVAKFLFIAEKSDVIFCKATAAGQTASDSVKIRVVDVASNNVWEYRSEYGAAPKIVFSDSMYLDEIGKSVVLPCRSFGREKSKITWLNPTEEIVDENDVRFTVTPMGDLEISNVEWDDIGLYTCSVENSFGEDRVSTFLYPVANE